MIIRTSIAAALVATTTFAAPAVAQTELSFNIFFPKTNFAWPVFQAWSEDIAAATDGEVVVTFPAQSVSPPPGVVDAVRNGVADGGFIFNGFIAQAAPGTMASQMPFISVGDSAAMGEVFWNAYTENFADVENVGGVEVVSAFHLGPTYLCSVTDTPITTLEDLQSRRVWALPGTIAGTLTEMDLSITASPAVQVQELASRNTVDAHLGLTMDTTISFGVGPYTKSCVETTESIQSASFMVFFNQRKWDRLSDEHRAAITELSGAALARRIGEAADDADTAARAELEAMGVTFAPINPVLDAAMREAANGVAGTWAEQVQSLYGIDGLALIEQMRADVAAASAN